MHTQPPYNPDYQPAAGPQERPQRLTGSTHEDYPEDYPDVEAGARSPKYQSPKYPSHPNLRNAFLRKVYTVLCMQLALTAAIAGLCAWHAPTRTFLLGNAGGFLWGSLISTVVIMIALSCGGLKHQHPTNSILLFLFTVCESVIVGVVCALYQSAGLADVLVGAAGLTLAIFATLTVYVYCTQQDFSFMGGFLLGGLVVMFGWGLLNAVFGWRATFVYAALGAVLFCAFILYDTSLVMQQYGVDEHVAACISLYLDIINLFLYLVQLLAQGRDRR